MPTRREEAKKRRASVRGSQCFRAESRRVVVFLHDHDSDRSANCRPRYNDRDTLESARLCSAESLFLARVNPVGVLCSIRQAEVGGQFIGPIKIALYIGLSYF